VRPIVGVLEPHAAADGDADHRWFETSRRDAYGRF
jgi:hypothetical protein